MKKIITSFMLSCCLFAGEASATTYLVNTGQGSGTSGAWALGEWQWLAAKFTAPSMYSISSIEGWMKQLYSNPAQLTAKLYSEGTDVSGLSAPGPLLYNSSFSVTGDAGWYGLSGLDWNIGPGNYWVAFEGSGSGDGYSAEMPFPAENPLTSYASLNYGWHNGMSSSYYQNQGDFLKFGVRIGVNDDFTGGSGTGSDDNISPVPEPSTFFLFGAGLGSLALYRRRIKKFY